MGEGYKGQYAPNLFNEQKRYYLFQPQEQANLTDAELRDMHLISNTNLRRFIQEEFGDSAIRDGFKIAEHPTDNTNNFLITGGDGSLDNPGVMFLKGYRLSLRGDIGYTDQSNTGNITADEYTKTILPDLIESTGSDFNYNGVIHNSGVTIVAGSNTSNVLKSIDYGRNFQDKACPATNTYSLTATGTTTFFAAGGLTTPSLLKSTNAGETWTDLYTTTDLAAADGTLYGVDFVNSSAGYVVGTSGQIYYTLDGGGSWVRQHNNLGDSTETLRSISALDSTTLWAVGDKGTILYSTNGTTWIQGTSLTSENINSVQVLGVTSIFACGNSGLILTKNPSWAIPSSDTSENLNAIFSLDSVNIWAVGNGGTITKSGNGGSTWDSTIINSAFDLNSIYFKDTTGFIAGGNSDTTRGVIYRTLDGGNTWVPYRTDYVYVDFHLAEVSGDTTAGSEYTDSTLVDPLIGLPSANRLRIVQDVKVSEGWPTPSDYTYSDSSGVVQHYTYTLATIQRYTGQSTILEADISDARSVVRTVSDLDYALKNGGIDGSSLASGIITPDKLDNNADFTIGSLYVLRDATICGDVRIEGVLHVEDQRESVITDSLWVKGSTILGDSSNDTVSISGAVNQVHDSSSIAYDLHALSGVSNATLINILQDSSGTVLRVNKTVGSINPLIDMTSVGMGYDLNISHSGKNGGILKSFDDSTNTSYLIQKDATGSTASVFDITTNSYGPAIGIHNTALCDSYSIKIDQSSGNALVINALSDASSIIINSTSSGTDLKIKHLGSSGYVMDVTSSGTGLLRANNTKGEVFDIHQTANANIMTLTKDSSGSGRVIEVNHKGVDPSVQINSTGDGISLHVSHTGDSSSPAVDIFVAGNETGAALRVTKANNDSTADVGTAVHVVNHGFSQAVQILHDNTDSTSTLLELTNYSRGLDASALNWRIDRSGNFFTWGDVTSPTFAFDSTYYFSSERFFLDSSNFDSSNPGIAGRVFQEDGFLRISDGTTQLDPPGGFGKTGIQGFTGLFGFTGMQGYTGLALGSTGISGVTGIQGVTGFYGDTGDTGDRGLTGLQGLTGLALGATGIQGLTGIYGITGIQGNKGDQGAAFQVDYWGSFDETVISTVQAGSYSSIDPYIQVITTDDRTNQNVPVSLTGDKSLHAVSYDGTAWVDFGLFSSALTGLFVDLAETDEKKQVKYRGASNTVYTVHIYDPLET
jgi:photosystem II stability/assembly factor-like uncharacterized protein